MKTDKLPQDATASTKGTIYQLCVAVQKCYEMVAGQKVLIECQGDVTIPGNQQVETKLYSDKLTDNHPNFWNTLHNWMQDGFNPADYSSLILYTTQQFGEHTTFSEWNKLTSQQRHAILEAITKQAEARLLRGVKVSGGKSKIPDVLLKQRFVLNVANRLKLLQVLERFVIEACSPNLPELHAFIKQSNIKGILEGKKDDFLNALIGFVTKAGAPRGQNWEITYEEFDRKVGELNTLYCRETRIFPKKYFDGTKRANSQEIDEHRDHVFVKKIQNIEHHTAIPKAISDYLGTVQTINEEFRNYDVTPSRTTTYANELVEIFESRHRTACRKCVNVVVDSQNFFDEITVEEPRNFEGFDKPPMAFRNGLLHTQLDDVDKNLHWRLKK